MVPIICFLRTFVSVVSTADSESGFRAATLLAGHSPALIDLQSFGLSPITPTKEIFRSRHFLHHWYRLNPLFSLPAPSANFPCSRLASGLFRIVILLVSFMFPDIFFLLVIKVM